MTPKLPPPLPSSAPQAAADLGRRRRARSNWIAAVVVAGVAGLCWLVTSLDDTYSQNAPYRRSASQSISGETTDAPSRFDAPAPAPTPVMPEAASGQLKVPDPAPERRANAPALAFPVRSATTERQPHGTRTRVLAEVRWCMFNEIRLQGARAVGTTAQLAGLQTMWSTACDGDEARSRDVQQVQNEIGHGREKLEAEGRSMVPPREAGR